METIQWHPDGYTLFVNGIEVGTSDGRNHIYNQFEFINASHVGVPPQLYFGWFYYGLS